MLRVFVISLKRATERRAIIGRSLDLLGVRFEFFDAVDGRALTGADLARTDLHRARRRMRRAMTLGEVGCALSHALLYDKIVRDRIANCIVLEDDALVGSEFAEAVKLGLLEESGYDMLLLYASSALPFPERFATDLGLGLRAYRLFNTPYVTCGYYLTQSGASRLLRRSFPISHVSDWPCQMHHWPGVRVVRPHLVRHRNADSFIGGQRYVDARAPLTWHAWLARFTILPALLSPSVHGDVSEVRDFWIAQLFRGLRVLMCGRGDPQPLSRAPAGCSPPSAPVQPGRAATTPATHRRPK